MSIFQAILWGVLQGLTEFIPVSSSGHLVLVPWLFHASPPGFNYDVIVHLGTLVALLVYFRRDVGQLLLGAWQIVRTRRLATPEARLVWWIVLSAIPASLLGFLFNDLIKGTFTTPILVSLLLLVTGALLMIGERLSRRDRPLGDLRASDAVVIGLAQACALLPGISRSGATIATGLLRGLDRESAARFSFLMVIPVILGATAWNVLRLVGGGGTSAQIVPLALGFAAALVSGYGALRFLLSYVRARGLRPFAYYCWGMGILGLVVALVR